MSDQMLPFAPWLRPSEKRVAPGVCVTTIYGHHALAAVLWGFWRWLHGDTFWKT